MLTRRETILGGALTLIWGNCACAQAGAASPHGFGCMLEPEQAAPLLASAAEPVASDQTFEKLFSSSGNRAFDYALAHTLSHLTDMFGVLPGFTFFDDYKGENAFATPATKLRRADGTVLFGKRYFDSAMKEAESPEVHVLATCAHEFGHIVQYKHKLRPRLTAGQPTVKRLELHADFFAGYFAGARKLQKPDFPAAVVAANRFRDGDFVTNKSHHGTPSERAAACVRGFETAYRERRSFADAIGIGVNYVERV
jgi:predicted metalloprotease